jgi:hypothetical protein
MYALGSTNAFPDVNLPPPTGLSLPKHWSRELFRTESTDPKAWVSGIRKACLETYVQLHEHIPRYVRTGYRKTISILTITWQIRRKGTPKIYA